ncbi:hypothetical protein G8V07_12495 [Clostridium botulinum D/C]|uniref:hypothetical protein n=1 Tax=Clostridium botulinum TaxID=1491 RepID=UPI001E4DD2D2|nr:hypothetical protein [Clostridium botulinum]MCD3321128.1 hypothetical protein [Clostridium botulinum D/C]MCD3324568.1 hypothetical protein [Clostridium botulinum D/C]MCD3326866.1 hypothetical protein [Clostridium botulinum D/C]
MSKMRTVNNLHLKKKNKDNLHDWQCKKLIPIDDLLYVVYNLLETEFVVDIDGYKHDLSFGYNSKGEGIAYRNSVYPSPYLCSGEFIEKAFRLGKWYEVSRKNLTKKERDEILKSIKEKEEWKETVFKRICK